MLHTHQSKSWINFLKHNWNIVKHLYAIKRLILGCKELKTFLPNPRLLMRSLINNYSVCGNIFSSSVMVFSLALLSFPSVSSTHSQMLGNLTNTKQKSCPVIQGLWKYVQCKDTTGREWLILSMKSFHHTLFCFKWWVEFWGYRYFFLKFIHCLENILS